MSKFELYLPIKSPFVTQGFGGNGKWYQDHGINIVGHNGIDFLAFDGEPVRAAHDGVVTFSGIDSFFGEYIEIVTHEEYEVAGVYAYAKTVYVHFQRGGRMKAAGDVVKAGDVIGLADNTGLSTGSHLHFGLKRVVPDADALAFVTMDKDNGYLGAIDPTPCWNGYNAADAEQVQGIYGGIIAALTKVIEIMRELIARKK